MVDARSESNEVRGSQLHQWCHCIETLAESTPGFCGGSMFFIAVDAYSMWPEVRIMSSTTVAKMLDVLQDWFARNGFARAPCDR